MSISWEIDKKVITKLMVNNVNIINPWGFETADSSAFFSLEEGIGWRYKILDESYSSNDKRYVAKIITKMKEGKWKLRIHDEIKGTNQVIRMVEAECLEDTTFMDFVMRFRFKKEPIEYALISGQKIVHKDTNIYYQHPVNNVFLKGKEFDVNIDIVDSLVPSKMKPVMYVRDNKGEWVVHVRMLPDTFDKEVIKICTRWAATRPLPQFISKQILKSTSLKEFLWYRGEFSPNNNTLLLKVFNPSAFPMVRVKKGTRLMWKVKVEVK